MHTPHRLTVETHNTTHHATQTTYFITKRLQHIEREICNLIKHVHMINVSCSSVQMWLLDGLQA